ncbi:TetR family transcriptional regulator [Streptomyces sp. NPDC052114]|uniref:TetR family transcriptional regulator n=1 Tax=unclassified Streptomyces TaxID=2593676 RepID=UPI003424DF81
MPGPATLLSAPGAPVSQARAVRTRRALVAAAAAEFDSNGYAGTSLSRVCGAAGVTMGALTFHFPTKGHLAAAVGVEGAALTREALRGTAARPSRQLRPLIELTVALVRLLEEDTVVRAAARLGQERAGAGPNGWHAVWLPRVRELLDRTAEGQGLADDGWDPDGIELLVIYLVAGAEAAIRAGRLDGSAQEHVHRLWNLLLSDSAGGRRAAPA